MAKKSKLLFASNPARSEGAEVTAPDRELFIAFSEGGDIKRVELHEKAPGRHKAVFTWLCRKEKVTLTELNQLLQAYGFSSIPAT